jgi:hypothetical protein
MTFENFDLFVHNVAFFDALKFHRKKFDIHTSSCLSIITNKPSWPNAAGEDSETEVIPLP